MEAGHEMFPTNGTCMFRGKSENEGFKVTNLRNIYAVQERSLYHLVLHIFNSKSVDVRHHVSSSLTSYHLQIVLSNLCCFIQCIHLSQFPWHLQGERTTVQINNTTRYIRITFIPRYSSLLVAGTQGYAHQSCAVCDQSITLLVTWYDHPTAFPCPGATHFWTLASAAATYCIPYVRLGVLIIFIT